MAAITLQGFAGITPKAQPYFLPETHAVSCTNARLENGELSPLRAPVTRHTLATTAMQIYLHGAEWLGFAGDADCVPGPVATDRLYITQEGQAPKVRVSGVLHNLALPTPTVQAAVARSGTFDPDNAEDFAYAWAWVTSLGEVSGMSPLSQFITWSPGTTITLSNLPGTPPANRLITHKRLFRAVTGFSGTAALFFLADIPASDVTYIHNPVTTPDGEPATNMDFAPAPAGLRGLTAMPNGMMVAFQGKELWFCEPYQPHAWPLKYMLTTNDWIVGLAAFGTSLAVLTTGTPYVVQGLHPDQMVMEKSEQPFPCLSKRSIVDMGYSAIYASTDGLVQIGAGAQAQLISKDFWSRSQWAAKQPMNIRSGRIGTRYAMGYLPQGEADHRIELIDTAGDAPFVVPTTLTARALYTQIESGSMFMLGSDGKTIREFDPVGGADMTYVWRSKPFRFTDEKTFGVGLVQTEDGAGALTAKVYRNGALFKTATEKDKPFRLPAGTGATWQIELSGTAKVIRAALAQTFAELPA